MFNKVPWFYNYSATGMITSPERTMFGYAITGPNASPAATYLFCLSLLVILAFLARNLTVGRLAANGWRSATWTLREIIGGTR